MTIQTEFIRCPFCNYDQFEYVTSRADDLKIVRCAKCDLAYVNPRPIKDVIYKMYLSDYYIGEAEKGIGYSCYRPSVLSMKSTRPFCFNYLKQQINLRSQRTLDIGCAFGSLVYWMAKAGAKATGIDLSPDGINWGRKMMHLDLRQTAVEELDEPDASFDIITMIDLLEHVVNLESFMEKVTRLLRPGGIIFLQTPNFGCFPKWQDKCTFLKISLEHLLYFEPSTLDALFSHYKMIPKVKTICLKTIPCDIDEYRKQCTRPNSLIRLIRQLPGIDYVRYLRNKLNNNQYLYNFDETHKEGAAIFALYQKR